MREDAFIVTTMYILKKRGGYDLLIKKRVSWSPGCRIWCCSVWCEAVTDHQRLETLWVRRGSEEKGSENGRRKGAGGERETKNRQITSELLVVLGCFAQKL